MSSKVNLSVVLFINATMAFAAPADNNAAVDNNAPTDNNAQVVNNAPLNKFNASLGLAIENSDNIYLTATNRKSDNIFHEIFSVNYARSSPTVQTQFSLNADRQQYQNKSFSDQTTYTSVLGLNTILIKNRLSWDVANVFRRVPINKAAPDLPNNQENVNYFNTGPTFIVLRDGRQQLNLSLNYNKTYAQKTEIDSSGYKAEAAYSRNLTRTFSVNLNLNHNVRNFVNTAVNADYSRTDSTITFIKRMRLSELDLTGGRSIIAKEGASNVENSIFRAAYKYQLGEKAGLNMSYNRELGDFTGRFSNTISGDQALPNVGSEIFLMELGDISINRNFGNSSIAYHYTYFSASYDNQALNTTTKSSQLSYTDKFSSAVEFNLSGTYQINTYDIYTRRDTLEVYAAGLSKKIAGTYDFAVKLQYINRNSNVVASAYDERRMTISGAYYF